MARMKFGVHAALEEEANRLIAESIQKGGKSHAAKSDILTPAKEQHRRRREVFVASGTPDRAIRSGVYGRAINRTSPHLNSRDGIAPPVRTATPSLGMSRSSLAEFVADNVLPKP